MNFKINYKEGKSFANISGDNNPIHLKDKEGHNSIFGEKICHGCLVLIKFLKKINIEQVINKKNQYSFKIIFYKHFSYDKRIEIFKKKNIYTFYQSNQIIAEFKIYFFDKSFNQNLVKKKIIKLKYKKNKKQKKIDDLSLILRNLSKYVGTIYPGKKSIIRDININFNNDINFHDNRIVIFSKKKDKRFPIINNLIKFKKYKVQFQTLFRPTFQHKKNKINKILKNKINQIKENILIIGASSGIGNELLNIFKSNIKIKIFASYYKNLIKIKKKNISIFKFDIEKPSKKIIKILNKFNTLKVYYLATPKIRTDVSSYEIYDLYKKYYIDYPIKIIKSFKKKNMQFFYPSTVYINKINSTYTKTKKEAERRLKKIKDTNIKINILRVEEVNTKQNLSLLHRKLPSFIELLNKNRVYQKKVFFN